MRRIGLMTVLLSASAAAALHAQVAHAPVAHREVLLADPANKFTYVGPPRSARLGTLAQAPPTAVFEVTYDGFPPEAQAAFQRAVDIWATQISTVVPITIRATFTPMGANALGGANAWFCSIPANPASYYPCALASQLAGSDQNGGLSDIEASFNSVASWYFGTGSAPANTYDFTTVVLHEIGHGLGFMGSAWMDVPVPGSGYLDFPPYIYDRFVVNSGGTPITAFSNGPTLAAQLTSNALFWSGPTGTLGNGGTRPMLYAPTTWLAGSSYSHTDEATYPAGNANSLMTPFLGAAEVILDPGPVMRGALRDMGWSAAGSGLPALTASHRSLTFGLTNNGAVATSPQELAITQFGGSTPVSWTASANAPWLQLSPSTTAGSGTVTVSVISVPSLPAAGSLTGQITLSAGAAWNTPVVITVTLEIIPTGGSGAPFGAFDTPVDGTSGVTGSTPVTGWALDDIEVVGVRVYRSSVGGEAANSLVFIGNAVMVDGARPDVEAAYPAMPRRSRAGWGYLMLTNALPGGGNGTFTLHAYADDAEGHTTFLGSRTLTCTNATATKPFGAIDTPGQGATASGASYRNFGWVLTPQPKIVPLDGSTVNVFIDGALWGPVNYGDLRPDVAMLFPAYRNSSGAGGYRDIDTTTLADGVHTIAWGVVDNAGVAEGIGSRYFTVRNGSGVLASAAMSRLTESTTQTASPASSLGQQFEILARSGFDISATAHSVPPVADGVWRFTIEELGRLELTLPYENCSPAGALPIGSAYTGGGAFTWAPGPGFVGDYTVTFSCPASDRRGEPLTFQIAITPRRPEGRRASVPRTFIDLPISGEQIDRPFVIAGWSLDEAAREDPGIATIHVWAYPVEERGYGEPIFLGIATLGGERPDVARVYGARFERSGFGLSVDRLPRGTYDVAVFPFTTLLGAFAPASTVRISIR